MEVFFRRQRPTTCGLALLILALVGCSPSVPTSEDEPRTTRAPFLDLDGPERPVDSPAPDSDPLVVDTVPHLVWDEMFEKSGVCVAPGCTTSWLDPLDLGASNPVAYVHAVSGGWHVAGPDDPWFTVLADVERDTDGDGSLDTRGLVLAWDPATRTLVDQPLLPDDFVSLGLLRPDARDATIWGLSIVDVDGDGSSEVITTALSERGLPILRFDPALGRLVARDDYRGDGPEVALAGGPDNLGLIDVDNDGLLDLEWARIPQGGGPPMTTFFQTGDGVWESRSLYPSLTSWLRGFGTGTLWSAAGGLQLRFVAGNDAGSCFLQQHAGGVPVLDAEAYPKFSACDFTSLAGAAPMGGTVADLNGDGRQELIFSIDAGHNLCVLEVHDFWTAQVFDVSDLYGAERPDALDRARSIIPWAIESVDLDRNGWRDLVAASGEDYEPFRTSCALASTCAKVQPIGIWFNPGLPSDAPMGTYPDLQFLPTDHISGNVPPVGDFNGGQFVNVDGDGDEDYLFSPVYGGVPRMFLDDTEGDGHGFCLRGHGTTSNPLGIGSFIEVETDDGQVQSFQLGGGGPGPNVHSGQPEICVGTGAFETATVRWTWPSGTTQTVLDVPATQGSEPGAYVIDEPAVFTVLDNLGRPTDRREPLGEQVLLQVCAYDPAPMTFGAQARLLTAEPWVRVDTQDFGGAQSTLEPSLGCVPTGCVAKSLSSPSPGQTRLTITVNGQELLVHPRLWWGD